MSQKRRKRRGKYEVKRLIYKRRQRRPDSIFRKQTIFPRRQIFGVGRGDRGNKTLSRSV